MSIHVRLKDSSIKEIPEGSDVLSLAQGFSSDFAGKTVGAFINSQSEISDCRTLLKDQDQVDLVMLPSPESLEVVRHSAAHVLAQAVQEIWPQTKVTIGPVIEDGFYYDFDHQGSFSDKDLIQIEKKMQEIISRKLKIEKEVWPAQKAREVFKKMGELYKIEIIDDIGEDEVSVYQQGDWLDLCRGPHVQHLGQIGAIKVMSHSSCYWKGDETQSSLQRIYATAFHSQKDLNEYLLLLEEAQKRDHRKIGREMNLFYFHDSSPGMPFFKHSGSLIYTELQKFLREKYKEHDYEEVISPQIYNKRLFDQSGHLSFYKENMYGLQTKGEEDSFLKPMNCPGHCLLYKSQKWSYRDLPWRVADFGRLHRFERSGTLHGLTRVRSFCQDDAHIFCSLSQLQEEIKNFMRLLKNIYSSLGLTDYRIDLCTRPEKKMGEDAIWDEAERALSETLKKEKIPFEISQGEGAFYGPKLDIMFIDSLKRKWQLGTLQCDFNLPEVFRLKYTHSDNSQQQPVVLHRAILGSLERFIGLYLEHRSGWLPLWLSPIQLILLNVSSEQEKFAVEVAQKLKSFPDCRVDMDLSSESLGYKVRKARLLRIPYMVIIGKKEVESQMLSVRVRGEKTFQVHLDQFLSQIKENILERKVGYSSF